ncbi:uncharacterized protein LOC124595328 [Schistocerca americana]|uniref:uncharacterized protein LOC124595328 n=1 Tax=Schistocerca americana TaxID=7009 RepID=UPI001F4FFACA|nr:uncharacterized protein LOC124595328 [Schistocerca americana]
MAHHDSYLPGALLLPLLLLMAGVPSAAPALKRLPSYVPLCRRGDPAFDECLRRATAELRPHLAKGVRELHIPPLEPLSLPEVDLQQDAPALTYRARLTGIQLYGLSDYVFSNVRADVDHGVLTGSLRLPRLRLEAGYHIDGTVLQRRIRGSGSLTANITDTAAEVEVRLRTVSRRGEKFLTVSDTALRLDVGAAMVLFRNLEQGSSDIVMATNSFLNENSVSLVRELRPAVESVAAMVLRDVLSKAFRAAPLRVLFPEDAKH